MSKPIELTLLAAEAFGSGEPGIETLKGVVHPSAYEQITEHTLVVRALERVEAQTHGRFEEIEPEPPWCGCSDQLSQGDGFTIYKYYCLRHAGPCWQCGGSGTFQQPGDSVARKCDACDGRGKNQTG